MSIITDALKKAEQERELKLKRVSEEAPSMVMEEARPVELFLQHSDVVETEIEDSLKLSEIAEQNAFHRSHQVSSQQVREISLIAGIVASCLFVLFVLPYWPGVGNNFSIVWPLQNVRIFQVPPMYQQNIFSMQPHSNSLNSVKLPFNLTGISSQGDVRYAIVNGVIVQKGDSVDGAQVKEILEREVVLETRAGELKLKIQS